MAQQKDLGVTENSLSQKLEIIVDRGFKDEKEAKNVAKKTLVALANNASSKPCANPGCGWSGPTAWV